MLPQCSWRMCMGWNCSAPARSKYVLVRSTVYVSHTAPGRPP